MQFSYFGVWLISVSEELHRGR